MAKESTVQRLERKVLKQAKTGKYVSFTNAEEDLVVRLQDFNSIFHSMKNRFATDAWKESVRAAAKVWHFTEEEAELAIRILLNPKAYGEEWIHPGSDSAFWDPRGQPS